MKMRTVLAAVIAAATVSAVSVCGFAEAAGTESGDAAGNESTESTPEAGDTTGNPDTGVEGVAAITGAIALAGAAVAISRKKD